MKTLVRRSLSGKISSVGVVMAGGYGTRFWPLSRRNKPKQYLSLSPGGETLLQGAVRRLSAATEAPLIVANEEHAGLVEEQLGSAALLLEPVGRNTAPCIAYAARHILETVGDVPMVCVPADHFIIGEQEYGQVLSSAVEIVHSQDVLVTIGIQPTYPETGYGYIERGESSGETFAVKRFVEKPQLQKAVEYLASGGFYWNAGIFAWRPSVILKAMAEFTPDIDTKLSQVSAQGWSDDSLRNAFASLKSESVDFGVMERATNAVVLPGTTFQWSDIGSWGAWADLMDREATKDIIGTEGLLLDCQNTKIFSENEGRRFIAGIGLDNLIVVDTKDALLVVRRDSSQGVKNIVEALSTATEGAPARKDLL